MKIYRVCIGDVAEGRLERIALELGRSVEDLIECAAEESALEYAKSRGWPLDASAPTPQAGLRLVDRSDPQ